MKFGCPKYRDGVVENAPRPGADVPGKTDAVRTRGLLRRDLRATRRRKAELRAAEPAPRDARLRESPGRRARVPRVVPAAAPKSPVSKKEFLFRPSPPPRNIHVAAAASPRPASAEDLRTRAGTATRGPRCRTCSRRSSNLEHEWSGAISIENVRSAPPSRGRRGGRSIRGGNRRRRATLR